MTDAQTVSTTPATVTVGYVEAKSPVLTWHDAGYRKRDLADETGLVVGCVSDGNAYFGGASLGRYIDHNRAQDAVMKAALASQVASARGGAT